MLIILQPVNDFVEDIKAEKAKEELYEMPVDDQIRANSAAVAKAVEKLLDNEMSKDDLSIEDKQKYLDRLDNFDFEENMNKVDNKREDRLVGKTKVLTDLYSEYDNEITGEDVKEIYKLAYGKKELG